MYFNPWVINRQTLTDWGNPETAHEYLLRESFFCDGCGASYRVRRIAEVLLQKVCKQSHQFLNQCLNSGEFEELLILQLNEIGGAGSLQETMGRLPNVTTTFYDTQYNFGKIVNGLSNQDISNLSFESNSFDLVIHSEVLEHVPDFRKAHAESIRVLKSGGDLVFTIPVQLNNVKSYPRFKLDPSGALIHQPPKIWHGWAGGPFAVLPKRDDYLELHSFGADALTLLNSDEGRLQKHQSSMAMKSGADWVFSFIKF
jgi:SAM-dependent methyltransferase